MFGEQTVRPIKKGGRGRRGGRGKETEKGREKREGGGVRRGNETGRGERGRGEFNGFNRRSTFSL